MRIRTVLGLLTALMTMAIGAAGCSSSSGDDGGSSNPPAPPGPPPPPPPAGPTATGNIGAQGGEVGFADNRFKLVIPAGALGNATAITITELTGQAIPQNLQGRGADVVYQLEPNGLQFATPARAIVKRPALLDPPAGESNVIVSSLNSNGVFEAPANAELTLDSSGATLEASIPHFSHYLVGHMPGVAIFFRTSRDVVLVEDTITVTASVRKMGAGTLLLGLNDDFSIDSDVGAIELVSEIDMHPVAFGRDETGTAEATMVVECKREGTGRVGYVYSLTLFEPATVTEQPTPLIARFSQVGDVRCTGSADDIIPTGVFTAPAGLRGLEGLTLAIGPFADFTDDPPYAIFTGQQGFAAVALKTQSVAYNGTGANAMLGTNLLGVMPISQAPGGRDSTAALMGYSNSGATTRHWLGDVHIWGAGQLNLSAVFDAKSAGGDLYSDGFAVVSPGRDIAFNSFDASSGLYMFRGGIPSVFYPGELIGVQYKEVGPPSPSLALTRSNATQRGGMFFHTGQFPSTVAEVTRFDGDARSLRCEAGLCFAALRDSDKVAVVEWDGTNTPVARDALDAPDDPFDLGVWRLTNGNVFLGTWSIGANMIRSWEIAPGGGVVRTTDDAVLEGCSPPGTMELIQDDDKMKAVLACHGDGGEGKIAVMTLGLRVSPPPPPPP